MSAAMMSGAPLILHRGAPGCAIFEEQIDKELLVIPPGTLPLFFVSAESKGSYF